MDILCDCPLSTGGTYRAALPSLWAGYCAAVFVPSNLDTGAVPGEGGGREGGELVAACILWICGLHTKSFSAYRVTHLLGNKQPPVDLVPRDLASAGPLL